MDMQPYKTETQGIGEVDEMSDRLEPKTAAWLDQVQEEIIDPESSDY